ncbi:DUF262 domain-containing protein [Microvirga solisilvae]|uniref:DUF262 domain-containing protein n=1 Tax=Microvirga solisilvae TaxID=2919498 RepID=UPI001FAFF5F3|nr:DUF262 domain-containing protein [Microvirga solisilvae]
MKPDKLTVHDLFQRERRYVVPLYQRAYVWNQQDQWEPLWDDIERQAEACFCSEGLTPKHSHFLGAIVLNVSRIVGAGVARSEVIDGQQRLTTLQILIAAIRDFAIHTNSAHAARLRRLTTNEDERPGSDGSYKVWPTNADREMFRLVLSAGSPADLQKQIGKDEQDVPRMASAYIYFYKCVANFVSLSESAEDRESRIFALIQALRTALQLVVIELEDGDDPQIIFETLNARGQPLLPSDLIRNYIFMKAASDPTCNADDLYNQFWRPFDDDRLETPINGEDRFWHVEERQGRLTRPRIDLFLFHYLVIQTERDLNIGQLFREFRDWREVNPNGVEILLADLKRYSSLFTQLVQPSGTDRASNLARRLRSLDTSTVYPVLLYVLSLPEERLSASSKDQILEDLESWLVRRFVCQLTNKNYNRFFVSVLTKLKRAATDEDLADIVRTELSRSSDVTTAWPTDEQFLTAWLTKPIYAKSRPDRSAMVLRAIEAHIRTSRSESITLPAKLTVEHLLPQKGSVSDYPYEEPMPLLEGEAYDRCRERVMHTIGNLTLLTQELNGSVSNGPFPAKVAKIVADSDLRLNAWLRSTPPSGWSEKSITERGETLFKAALEIWPRPALEPENVNDTDSKPTEGRTSQFTDPELLQAKRDQIVSALALREDTSFQALSLAKYANADGAFRAIVAVSKPYLGRDDFRYWYAYHPESDEFLAGVQKGFLLIGCMDRDHGYAIPRSVIAEHLTSLNTTTRNTTKKMHYHIHLTERSGKLMMTLPKANGLLDISPYKISLAELADLAPA